jgi:hypothetical protein
MEIEPNLLAKAPIHYAFRLTQTESYWTLKQRLHGAYGNFKLRRINSEMLAGQFQCHRNGSRVLNFAQVRPTKPT